MNALVLIDSIPLGRIVALPDKSRTRTPYVR